MRYLKFLDETISSEYPQTLIKCKRCKAEFAVLRNAGFIKSVCYCPYCGQPDKRKVNEDEP